MKMRRLEMAILSITLAFAFFMGGFFTGRSHSAVSIAATMVQTSLTPETAGPVQPEPRDSQSETPQSHPQENPGTADADDMPAPQETHGGDNLQGTGEPKENDGKININTASHGELTDLPGIGNTLASRIVDYRTQNGAFARIEDIRNVSGIGEKRYEAIKDLIKT